MISVYVFCRDVCVVVLYCWMDKIVGFTFSLHTLLLSQCYDESASSDILFLNCSDVSRTPEAIGAMQCCIQMKGMTPINRE